MSVVSNGVTTSSTSLRAGKFYFSRLCLKIWYANLLKSLEKDTARRASPWRMLEHPWIVEMKNKKVNMYNFLAQVWEWE